MPDHSPTQTFSFVDAVDDLLDALRSSNIPLGANDDRISRRKGIYRKEQNEYRFAKCCGAISTLLIDQDQSLPLAAGVALENIGQSITPFAQSAEHVEFSVLHGLIGVDRIRRPQDEITLLEAYATVAPSDNRAGSFKMFRDRVSAYDTAQIEVSNNAAVSLQALKTATEALTKTLPRGERSTLQMLAADLQRRIDITLQDPETATPKSDPAWRRQAKDPETLKAALQPAHDFWSPREVFSSNPDKIKRIQNTMRSAHAALQGNDVAALAQASAMFLNIRKWAIQGKFGQVDDLSQGLELIDAIKVALLPKPAIVRDR